MIPYHDFTRLLTDTKKFETPAAYIANYGGSVPLDDTREVCKLLQRIWALGHDGLSVQRIADTSDRALRALAQAYGIPYRTMQDWKSGERHPPEWQLPLIAYAVLSDLD